jgi:hypothetical protein
MITLSASEMMLAAQAGVMRTVENMVRGANGNHGSAVDDWTMSIEGALAEWAASKAIGIHWPGKGQMRSADAGNLQIRSTPRPDGCLILHPADNDGDMFVLMVGSGRNWQPKGFMRAQEGKIEKYWKEGVRSPAFFVPQSALHPILELF